MQFSIYAGVPSNQMTGSSEALKRHKKPKLVGKAIDAKTAVEFAKTLGMYSHIRYRRHQVWMTYEGQQSTEEVVKVIHHRIKVYELDK